jgi:hypothetical protein
MGKRKGVKGMTRKVFQVLAATLDAWITCVERGNTEWIERHEETIKKTVRQYMPSGSGWDSGTEIDTQKSTGEKLVFHGSFHHMNENGMYDGYTEHSVTVKPSLVFGFVLSISGRNRNDIKEYLYELFEECLSREVKE